MDKELPLSRRVTGVIDEITDRKLRLKARRRRVKVSAEIRRAIELYVRDEKLPEQERAAS